MASVAVNKSPSIAEKRFVLRTRTCSGHSPEDIIDMLRGERFTGNMVVNFSQGGVCSVIIEERTQLPHLTAANNCA